MAFVVLPSRKPKFWADVERFRKAEAKPKKAEPAPAKPAKKKGKK